MDTTQNDHDLLIELRTEMRGMRADVIEIKTNTVSRIANLEADHISKTDYDTLTKDVGKLKLSFAGIAAVGTVIIVVLIPIVSAYISAGKL
jgi:hypothetical protein